MPEPASLRILGIDPGLQRTGFGVIDAVGARLHYVASGTIGTLEAPRGDVPARLKLIFSGVQEVVRAYAPHCASVEIVFVNVNPQSTLLLGQARGAALAAPAQAHSMASASMFPGGTFIWLLPWIPSPRRG